MTMPTATARNPKKMYPNPDAISFWITGVPIRINTTPIRKNVGPVPFTRSSWYCAESTIE